MGGAYLSAFHGAGQTPADVRPYEPGDDVRAIDWNVTARLGQPYLKRHVAERELSLLLIVDISGSMEFGSRGPGKRGVAADLAAVLAFAALAHGDRVGLILVSDRIEHAVPPRKGLRHGQRLLRDLLYFRAARRGTDLGAAMDRARRGQRRRAIVVLISDFADDVDPTPLRRLGRRHDLVAIRVRDPLEAALPDAGCLELIDAESGRRALIDSGSPAVRAEYARRAAQRDDAWRSMMSAANAEVLETTTAGDHLDALVRWIRRRRRRRS